MTAVSAPRPGWELLAGQVNQRRYEALRAYLFEGLSLRKAADATATINHALTVVHGYYAFHGRFGAGPVTNPVPVSAQRRQVLAHRSPLEPVPVVHRARLRQRVPQQAPRAIPDALWDELFAAMGCDRDRALLESYVSSGARASELLGVTLADIDWAGRLFYVVSKGSRLRQPVPASPDAFRYLGRYLATDGLPAPAQPVWRTRRGDPPPADLLGDAAVLISPAGHRTCRAAEVMSGPE